MAVILAALAWSPSQLNAIGVEAFKHALDRSSLKLSWRTDRIPKPDTFVLKLER